MTIQAPTASCGWNCGDIEPGHKHYTVIVRENGRLLGRLCPDGTTTRVKIHAAILSRAKADKIAERINAGETTVPGITARVNQF